MEHKRTYPRGRGLEAFNVYFDRLAQNGRGLFRVLIGTRRIGAQVSFPSADDCERMLAAAPTPGPIKPGLSPLDAQRARLGRERGARSNHVAAKLRRAKRAA